MWECGLVKKEVVNLDRTVQSWDTIFHIVPTSSKWIYVQCAML